MKNNGWQGAMVRAAAGFVLAAIAGGAGAAEPPKGLVLHYNFDKADPGGWVEDRSGQKNGGKLKGAWWEASGKQGGGCRFGATNSFINVPDSPTLNVTRGTFAAWFKTSRSDGKWRRILDKRADNGYGLGIAGDSKEGQNRGKVAAAINGKFFCLGDNVVTDGAWHHVAATYDGSELRLYVDALPQRQTVSCPGGIATNAGPLTIGMTRAGKTPVSFDGVLDEVMIFNRALSGDEIKAMVQGVDPSVGKPKFTKQQVAGRLRQLKLLFEEGLLTEEFYREKVKECEAAD